MPPVECRVDAAVVRLAHRAALAALVQLRGGVAFRKRVGHAVLQFVALAHRAAVFVFDLFVGLVSRPGFAGVRLVPDSQAFPKPGA